MSEKTRHINLNGNSYKLRIKKNHRAKRIILKVSNYNRDISLTIPKYHSEKEGIKFFLKNKKWALNELNSLPKKILLADRSIIPYRGIPHKIIHLGGKKSFIYIYQKQIIIYGDKQNLSNNLKKWLQDKAILEISTLANEKVKILGKVIKNLKIKELRTCWGSCSENGNLSFSWRLILAPPSILEYIVVHEVCHLVELNHSQKFWELVTDLFPHKDLSKKWLKTNGTFLHLIG